MAKIHVFSMLFCSVLFISNINAKPADPYGAPPEYKEPGRPYAFAYGIKDQYSGVNVEQNEESDGNVVKGSYSVDLPDGRKQQVNYIADHEQGYQADVTYEGEAKFPAPAPAPRYSQPAKPQAPPVYSEPQAPPVYMEPQPAEPSYE